MADTVGQADLRAEHVERMVKGFALQNYIFKEVVMVNNSNSWKESYYQETAADLEANGTRNVKGVPRLAKFPHAEVSWTKKSAYVEKYGLEGTISYEDWLTNEVDVIARTLLRIARGVTKAVDEEIYNTLSENDSPNLINEVAISGGNEWDSSTVANRDPFQDILNAIKEITIDNYDPYSMETFLIVSPTDFANMMGNEKIQRMFKEEIGKNGRVGKLAGLTVKVSNSITADNAMVVVGKICATWKAAVPLTVATIEDKGVNWTIRAFELGVTQLTNPEAVCLITNTQE